MRANADGLHMDARRPDSGLAANDGTDGRHYKPLGSKRMKSVYSSGLACVARFTYLEGYGCKRVKGKQCEGEDRKWQHLRSGKEEEEDKIRR